MRITRFINSQRGDTIVEVLIAIAICGSVLGSAYAIVNRTTKSQQQSTEHTEALKVAESQLEGIRSRLKDPANTVDADFCFSSVGNYQNDISHTDCRQGAGGRYNVKVDYDSSADTFLSTVSWSGINGGTDQVQLTYKAYRP